MIAARLFGGPEDGVLIALRDGTDHLTVAKAPPTD